MLRPLAAVALTGALGLALATAPASAQGPGAGARPPNAAPPGGAPPMPAPPTKNPADAPAGTYQLDPGHQSVIARVGHGGGVSLSTFRFGTAKGSLTWDPAKPEASKLDVTVDPKSITSPVPNFGDELGGQRFLNSAQFPDARFVSTAIQRTGPTTGRISGNLTLMGQTKPVTINGELVGVGKTMRGQNAIGFTGNAKFKRSDFGFGAMVPMIGDEVELLIDVEFLRQG